MRRLPLGILRLRDFRLLFLAKPTSEFGDRLVPVALAFAVLDDLDASAAALGIVLAARTIPQMAFVLVGGVWADRLPRQRVMFASDAGRFAIQAAVAALLLTENAEVWHLVVLQAAYGVADA